MKLVILDSNALIHRAYHALPPLTSPKGEPTSAIYGFYSTFIKMVNDLKPDYLVAAFDRPEPTFRHKAFLAYKAQRPKTPDDLIWQLQKVKESLSAIGVLVIEKAGYEADDIIGTLVGKLHKEQELEIIIVTGDLDTLQLVRDGVKIYTMKRGISDIVIYDQKAVMERFSLPPEKLADYKGLVGDASDNIPGISGIGPKTAIQLLQKFGVLEGIFDSKEIPEKLKGKREEALFSKELATINTEVPLSFHLEDSRWKGFAVEKIEPLFKEFAFQSLFARISSQNSKKPADLFSQNQESSTIIKKSPDEEKIQNIALWLLDPEKKNASLLDSLNVLKERMREEGVINIFEDIEIPLLPILEQMSKEGIGVDQKTLKLLQADLEKDIYSLKKEITRIAGEEFNPNSSDQLRTLLFEKLKISPKYLKKTPGGKISTKESQLFKIIDSHIVIGRILKYRELEKLLTTYVVPFFQKIEKDGKIHTTFNQTGTTTGRLSSENPNLQNIPSQGEYALRFKNIFVPTKGFLFVSFDYSQIELRIAAHLSDDKDLKLAFKKGEDIHTHTASKVFGVALEKVTKEMRRIAKVFNFGILYGLGSRGLSENLRISQGEAKKFIYNYFERFSGVKEYIQKIRQEVIENGYVKTHFGRKRWFYELKNLARLPRNVREAYLREAVNMPIQGTAADIVKLAMIEVDGKIMKGHERDVHLLLQIHDDLLFEIKQKKINEYAPQIKKIMEHAVKLSVPLNVEVKIGARWGELVVWNNELKNHES